MNIRNRHSNLGCSTDVHMMFVTTSLSELGCLTERQKYIYKYNYFIVQTKKETIKKNIYILASLMGHMTISR